MAFLSREQLEAAKEAAKGDQRYLRLNQLETNKEYRLRFQGAGVTGWEIWVKGDGDDSNDECIRYEVKPDELPDNVKPDLNGRKEFKPFLAGIVWDEQINMFRILYLTQTGVMNDIFKYMDDRDYGDDPTKYDIKITKRVKNDKTSYDVIAAPPREVDPAVAKAFKELECNLLALFDTGGDPWATKAKK